MVGIIDSLLGLDIISILIGVGIGLAPTIGFLIVRGTLFEYQEWRKRRQEQKEWFNEVWRAANGIQEAWYYSGARPEEEDRVRTAEEMDELTDRLKEYKRYQNATDEMVEVMKSIIESWDGSRDIILIPYSSQPYYMRGGFISDDAEELKELVEWERKGQLRKFIYSLPQRGRSVIERVRRWWYQHKDEPLPYEVHKAISTSLSGRQLSEFIGGNAFLSVNREYATYAIYYDSDEDKYNLFEIDSDEDGEINVIDKYPGGILTERQLLDRLEATESIDTISYEDIVPDGQTLDEFEHSD